MGELEDKLNSILGNPQMMQNIMNMAQQMSSPDSAPGEAVSESANNQFGANEMEMIQKIAAFSRSTGLDPAQKGLIQALNPYLSENRVAKLEKAMHAAKLAQFASVALSGSNNFFGGGK